MRASTQIWSAIAESQSPWTGLGCPAQPRGLVVEVLSASTETYDREGKFALYRQIPTLREYLLVSQDRVRVELYRPAWRGWPAGL